MRIVSFPDLRFPSVLAELHDLSPAVHVWPAEQHLLIANPPLTSKFSYVDQDNLYS